ncbi:hypothetical protein UFOVP274_21 [uncultured Caudovirales phage]|uniref:Uncharacterized protein n=1 Tax=uncultured Caudovirales phage TaxID=2100421 RepID=A0A6J5LJ63_9CAUD|nr:hypothetical protein UFOVP274_21 [uncultured Caudovirales phage]
MTTSGTSSFNPDLTEIIEEAFERAGKELRTGYEFRTARRSMNLLFADWANRGVNMWTLDTGTITLVQGTATYDLPSDTVDLLDHVVRTGAGSASTQADLTITRISMPTYSSIPNKLTQARPIQVWVNRQTPIPNITVWPIPDGAQTYQFIYWRLRRIQDAGNGVNTVDMPFRFLPALVAGLAYYIALKIPEGIERLPILKAQYDEAWQLASQEDREKAAIRFVPRRTMMR